MPCGDVTEVLELQLDVCDRLLAYRLTKRTCGAEVGQASLLQHWIENKSVEQLLAADGADLVDHFGAQLDFLVFKHLVALQEVLRVYRGESSGTPADPCALACIKASPDGVRLSAHLRVELLTDKIAACSHCGRCGVAQLLEP